METQTTQEATASLILADDPLKAVEPAPLVLDSLTLLTFAVALKYRREQQQFRGLVPRGQGFRSQARSQGYTDYAHMQRLLAGRRVQMLRDAGVPEEKIADAIAKWTAPQPAPVVPNVCTAKQAEQAVWNANVKPRRSA